MAFVGGTGPFNLGEGTTGMGGLGSKPDEGGGGRPFPDTCG